MQPRRVMTSMQRGRCSTGLRHACPGSCNLTQHTRCGSLMAALSTSAFLSPLCRVLSPACCLLRPGSCAECAGAEGASTLKGDYLDACQALPGKNAMREGLLGSQDQLEAVASSTEALANCGQIEMMTCLHTAKATVPTLY